MRPFRGDFPDTPMSRLHPLAKLAGAVALATAALVFRTPAALGLLALVVAVAIFLGRRRLGLAGVVVFGLPPMFVACGNCLIGQSLGEAAKYGLRMAVLFGGLPLCALTTRPEDLTRALARLRLPTGILISLLLIWRFIPVLAAQVSEVREASRLRGTPRSRSVRRLFRGSLLPVIFASVDYAERLGLALELRGFAPGERRTWYRVPAWTARDAVFALAVAAAIALAAIWEHGAAAG